MKVRLLKKKEIKDIVAIIKRFYPEPSSNLNMVDEIREMFKAHIFRPTYLVAEDKEKIIGMVGYASSRINYRVYQIFSVLVEPAYQNNGIGTDLMKRAISEIMSLKRKKEEDFIILLTSVKQGYFKKFGFKILDKINANGSSLMALRV